MNNNQGEWSEVIPGGCTGRALTRWLTEAATYGYPLSLCLSPCLSIYQWSTYQLCFLRPSLNVSQVASAISSGLGLPKVATILAFWTLLLALTSFHGRKAQNVPSWPSTHAYSSCSLKRSQSHEKEEVHQQAIPEREQ